MYRPNLLLKDNEIPAAINADTGEMREVKRGRPRNPNVESVESTLRFTRQYVKSWQWLRANVSSIAYLVAQDMALMAKPITNSLEPLNGETTIAELATRFQVDRRKVKSVLEELFQAGVYAGFEVYEAERKHTKYWVLNPELSFSGAVRDVSIMPLFRNTRLSKAMRRDINIETV